MSISDQWGLDDRGFGPAEDENRGDAPHDSQGRHPYSHSLPQFEHHGWLEGSHAGGNAPPPADHSGGLGWGATAWGEAGGFEHVLGGGMAGPQSAGPIDHLAADEPVQTHVANAVNITFDTGPGGTLDVGGNVEAVGNQSTALDAVSSHDSGGLPHNTQVEITDIIFNVASGGTIDVGGNVEALGNQSAALNAGQSHDFNGFLHNTQVETTDIIFNVASGGTIDVGGNVEALGNQFTALNAGQSHDFGGLLHNTQVETTEIIFNVANGGTIDVAGNIEAASAQQSLAEPHVPEHLAHLA
ncbi:MAG: hypothetical protein P4M09_03805 [Devosia sp.]|nr:hypothetical protein [Devosia sp.]